MKLKIGFVSNSSTTSFIICKSFLQDTEYVQQILDWYAQKSESTYMDDCGSCIKNDKNYISGTIAYVGDDFWKLMKKININEDQVILIED